MNDEQKKGNQFFFEKTAIKQQLNNEKAKKEK